MVKSTIAFITSFTTVLCFLLSDVHSQNSNSIQSHANLRQGSISRKLEEFKKEIPKIAHFVVLGNDPPSHILEMVRVNIARIQADGWKAILWSDEDAERLVTDYGDERITQSWEWVKNDSENWSKRADFLKPLIMYVHGGVYLDPDMVPCESLDYLTDEPGFVSFPFLEAFDHEVNGAAMSSPPGHFLMSLVLEEFISLGPDIEWMKSQIAVGPARMGIVTDLYMEFLGLNIPYIFSNPERDLYKDAGDATVVNYPWTQILDIRFMKPNTNDMLPTTYRLHSESKTLSEMEKNEYSRCYENYELIEGFVEHMCIPENRNHDTRFHHCGKEKY